MAAILPGDWRLTPFYRLNRSVKPKGARFGQQLGALIVMTFRQSAMASRAGSLYMPRIVAHQRKESPMPFNPEEWEKLSEQQRQAIIKKIEREEKLAKTALVVI